MSVCFAAILDHHIPQREGFASMPLRLTAMAPLLEEMCTYQRDGVPLGDRWEPWEVMNNAPRSLKNPPYCLMGGAGFYISFGERSVYVEHITRYYRFISDEKPRELLVRFCQQFGQILGSRCAFYGSENSGTTIELVTSGLQLNDIEQKLLGEGYEKISPLESYCQQAKALWDAHSRARKLFCIEDL